MGRWNFWLMFAGFNLTFFPMHQLGLAFSRGGHDHRPLRRIDLHTLGGAYRIDPGLCGAGRLVLAITK
jgi:hypothetical protein